MNSRKNILVTTGLVLSVSLIAAAAAVWLAFSCCSGRTFAMLGAICTELTEREPKSRDALCFVLKDYTSGRTDGGREENLLTGLGYEAADFSAVRGGMGVLFAAAGLFAGLSLFGLTCFFQKRAQNRRIQALREYLEEAVRGRAPLLFASGEDDFSMLEDEIYKTVTCLYQTKDQAVQAKNHFAENLSNIAHQIKTPITALSLSLQKLGQKAEGGDLKRMEKQLLRLTSLEEALLLLSRLDAGTLVLQKKETDVFTLLMLAADNLQEHFWRQGASVEIPEQGRMCVFVDLEWTMEALMNLMKNCLEHAPGGTVYCSCAQNPLYTQILIWDEGEGFAKEDLPHLFERFYRGKNSKEGGIGIGLALAKEIIERQNGTIRAANRSGGGALFEVRFYCH